MRMKCGNEPPPEPLPSVWPARKRPRILELFHALCLLLPPLPPPSPPSSSTPPSSTIFLLDLLSSSLSCSFLHPILFLLLLVFPLNSPRLCSPQFVPAPLPFAFPTPCTSLYPVPTGLLPCPPSLRRFDRTPARIPTSHPVRRPSAHIPHIVPFPTTCCLFFASGISNPFVLP